MCDLSCSILWQLAVFELLQWLLLWFLSLWVPWLVAAGVQHGYHCSSLPCVAMALEAPGAMQYEPWTPDEPGNIMGHGERGL
jgi:hypothetical protein